MGRWRSVSGYTRAGRSVVAISLLTGWAGASVAAAPAAYAGAADTTYAVESVSTLGTPIAGQHLRPQLSSDGRWLAFDSGVSTLVPGDTANLDVFVRDRDNGTIERATVADDGSEPNGSMYFNSSHLSADGRHVTFTSTATNLVAGDTNGSADVFVRDLVAGTTELVGISPTGELGNTGSYNSDISGDGRYVVFNSAASNWAGSLNYGGIFLRDRTLGTTTLLVTGSPDTGSVFSLRISADGNVIVYVVQGQDARTQLWAFDRQLGTSERVDVTDTGLPGAGYHKNSVDLSSDGTVIAFEDDGPLVASDSNGQADVYVRDRTAGTTTLADRSSVGTQPGSATNATISDDGRFVGFVVSSGLPAPAGLDPGTDAYVRDRLGGSVWHVGVDGYGANSLYLAADIAFSLDGDGQTAAIVAGGGSGSGLVPSDGNRYVFSATRAPDTDPPVVYGYTTTPANAQGWFSAPPTIEWSAYDPAPSWGQPSSPPGPVVASLEGDHVYTSAVVCDQAARCATGSIEVKLDSAAPTADLPVPADGAEYTFNQVVAATYSCTDNGDSGISTCAGTSASGSLIDTSAVGVHDFVVTTTDNAGNTASVTHSYTVDAPLDSTPPVVSLSVPVNGSFVAQNAVVVSQFTCTDELGGSGLASCVGTGPNGIAVDTSTAGQHTFSVTGTDVAGNSQTATTTYNVVSPVDVTTTLPVGGGILTTDAGGTGPTVDAPLQTSVTSPGAGLVEIVQTGVTVPDPVGYTLFGFQSTITAPLASASSPLTLGFSFEGTLLASQGLGVADVAIFRDGIAISPCTDPGTAVASPDPCVFARTVLPGGDAEIDVYTSHASQWGFGSQLPTSPLTVTTTSLPGATVGVPYSTSLAAAGGAAPYTWSIASGSLPAGLSLDAATGVVSGVPTASGPTAFAVRATDVTLPTARVALASLSIAVAPSTNPGSAKIGVAYSLAVPPFAGVAPYHWSISAGHLPGGLSLNRATGVISGTPTTEGAFAFTVQVTDSRAPTPRKVATRLTISVAPVAITISPTSLAAAHRSVWYSRTLTASGGAPTYVFKVTSGTLPVGIKLSSSGVLSGRATASGSASFTVTATDKFGFKGTRSYLFVVT